MDVAEELLSHQKKPEFWVYSEANPHLQVQDWISICELSKRQQVKRFSVKRLKRIHQRYLGNKKDMNVSKF